MAHQYLEQLRDAGELVYHGVMGTANNKVVFKLNNPEDAAIMADRVFAGEYNFTMAKDYKPVVVGTRVRRLRGWSKQEGQTSTESLTETNVKSISRAQGYSEGASQGTSEGAGMGLSLVMPEKVSRLKPQRLMMNTSRKHI